MHTPTVCPLLLAAALRSPGLRPSPLQLATNARRLYGLNLCRGLGDKFLKDEDLGGLGCIGWSVWLLWGSSLWLRETAAKGGLCPAAALHPARTPPRLISPAFPPTTHALPPQACPPSPTSAAWCGCRTRRAACC